MKMWTHRNFQPHADTLTARTPGGIPVFVRFGQQPEGPAAQDLEPLRLHVEHARLRLLRGFEELLCLDGLQGVEHLPHQIETVRRVLRHFRGRVLLADEVGLGKTIEACLLLREYLLRGLVSRVLILTPPALVGQWREELLSKFSLDFAVPPASLGPEWWSRNDRVLASLSLAKNRKNFDAVSACPWDLAIIDEAHHCKNRTTRNWQLVNALKRRHLFLLTATPVQNDLVELYNLLTLLEPGHLKTESDFKKNYMRRGSPRDPRNRERLRSLLFQVMIRNTRSLVNIDLPPRYAQTFVLHPGEDEAELYGLLDTYLRWRHRESADDEPAPNAAEPDSGHVPTNENGKEDQQSVSDSEGGEAAAMPLFDSPADEQPSGVRHENAADLPAISRMQLNALLMAAGSHPATLVPMLEQLAKRDPRALPVLERARRVRASAKERKLIELLREKPAGKILVFANFRGTIVRLAALLRESGIAFSVFSGEQTAAEKDRAVHEFQSRVPVMLCSESGGEGRNLQFANTLINFDLPWNPMRIEQRVGRIHRIGQTQEVFIFNLCTAGTLEERILRLLNDKIRMFELIVGEVGSILGNLEGGEEFESLVLNLWMKSKTGQELDAAFENLGESLLQAHEQYVQSKQLDDALFGEEYQ